MEWNKAQKQAIENRGNNLLVAAAAGSGKTTVLIERIKRLILEDRIPVDRFLIVTFTKAAASEMKEKIVTALTKAIDEAGSREDIVYLKRQLDLVGRASISTFHSFALDVIRRYFYLTDVEPDFRICDEAQSTLLKAQAVDELFSDKFAEKNQDFIDFITCYASDRNERKAKDIILETYRMIQSIAEPFEWLEQMTENLSVSEEEFEESGLFDFVKEDTAGVIDFAEKTLGQIAELLSDAGVYSLSDKFETALAEIRATDISGMNYSQMKSAVSGIEIPRMAALKAEKEAYELVKEQAVYLKDGVKKQLEYIRNRYYICELSEYIEDINRTYRYACILKELVTEFSSRFKALKAEKSLIDFNDIEHYALEILGHEEAAAEYRDKFEYIFIDEYQDSNDVQDTLISRIKRENNLFMVGDVKQSIYKFRLAEPELFMKKYAEYSHSENSLKIDLNQNFRSKGKVLAAVNTVFESIMEDYGPEAALHKGIAYEGELDVKPKLVILDRKTDPDIELDEEIAGMKKAETEALVAADIIKKTLGQKIYDAKKGCEREITRRDIVILMRSTRINASVFAQILENENIPVYVDDSDGYFDTIEISLVEDMLSLIDNSRQDIPLIGVLHSPVFGFTIDELADIRLECKDVSYYEAFRNYVCCGSDPALKAKCAGAEQTIAGWKQLARDIPLSELVWKLIWETGYYTYAGALPGGSQRQANLRALADRAMEASEGGIYDVYGFLKYIEAVKARKIEIGQIKTVGENDDVVRIMTIHKSKGLEFPVVIGAGMGSRFNFRNKEADLALHKQLGIGITYINPAEHWKRKTLIQNIIEKCIRNESFEEEKRILYVELTRAMDRLIMIGSVREFEGNEYKYMTESPETAVCPLDLAAPAAYKEGSGIDIKIVNMQNLSANAAASELGKAQIRELIEAGRTECSDEIRQKLSFEYGNMKEVKTRYKYSVTELNKEAAGETRYNEISLKIPAFAAEDTGLSAAMRGSATHKVMEHIDFVEENLDSIIEELAEKNILTDQEKQAVNREGILSFIRSDIGRRAAKADVLRREQPFTILMDKDGTEIMVQGVIDCFFEENGQLVLVDYKNSTLKSEELLKSRYRQQLDIYAEALEKITQKPVKERYLFLLGEGKSIKM